MNDALLVERDVRLTEVSLPDYVVRGALVTGSTCALVWDPLSHPRDMNVWHPFIEGIDLVIVYSHADWDHAWGTAGLPFERARIVGHRTCAERFGSDVPQTLAAKRRAEPGAWDDVRLVPPTEVFDDEATIELGPLSVGLHHLPGHTADTVVGFVPERGVLLVGDAAETPLPVVPCREALPAWIAGLERWEADARVRLVVPAHGRVGGREILQQNIRYLQRLLNHTCETSAFELPGPLAPFYRETHGANLRAVRSQSVE
jgi:glyoxylase-like metal-dependent hydrolase (beta-lactamase superfamily II)